MAFFINTINDLQVKNVIVNFCIFIRSLFNLKFSAAKFIDWRQTVSQVANTCTARHGYGSPVLAIYWGTPSIYCLPADGSRWSVECLHCLKVTLLQLRATNVIPAKIISWFKIPSMHEARIMMTSWCAQLIMVQPVLVLT